MPRVKHKSESFFYLKYSKLGLFLTCKFPLKDSIMGFFSHLSEMLKKSRFWVFCAVHVKTCCLVHTVSVYLPKCGNKNTRRRPETCSKLKKKHQKDAWRRCDVFIVNFHHVLHLEIFFSYLESVLYVLVILTP